LLLDDRRMAANLGFATWIVSDATATFARRAPGGETIDAETMHCTALASLMDEFASVVRAADALALLDDAATSGR
jgi:nicotinamidase-related amidase